MKWRATMMAGIVMLAGVLGGTASADEHVDDYFEITGLYIMVLFDDIETETTRPEQVHIYEDSADDQVNPFFGTPIDQLDTSLPLFWEVLSGAMFTTTSPTGPVIGDNLVHIEAEGGSLPLDSGYTFYGRYTMPESVDNRGPLGNYWCQVSVYAHDPDRPTTIPASVIDEDDPAHGTNLRWTVWFGPDGETTATKTVVNSETRVAQAVENHSTHGVVEDNVVTIMFPADEIAGTDRVILSTGCQPLERTDYGLHTRDLLADVEVGSDFFEPAWMFGAIEQPTDSTGVTASLEEATDLVADESDECTDPDCPADTDPDGPVEDGSENALAQPAEAAPAAEPEAGSNLVPITFILLGLGAIGLGAYGYRREGGQT